MRKEQYIVTGSSESYTYPSLIIPIIPYIEEFRASLGKEKEDFTIWCPFDTDKEILYNGVKVLPSNYVRIFREQGYNVINSHIATGQDFFTYEPEEEYDVIISNSPFKNKKKFFERAIELDKPFAIVNTAAWLNDGGVYNVFKDIHFQLLMPDKRARFFNENGCIGKQPSFKSVYYCREFLVGQDIAWCKIDRDLEK